MINKNDCSCSDCQGACNFKPGWMLPGEEEKIAKFLGVSREAIRQTERRALWKLRNNEELRRFYLCWTRFDK